MQIPKEIAPYFECCFVLGFSFCEECTEQANFTSSHRQFSDEWWLDEAAAMKSQGWVVPKSQAAYCAACAQKLGLEHDPSAYVINIEDF